MKFKIGDKVVIRKSQSAYQWYSTEIYTIEGFDIERKKVAILNKDLPKVNGRLIHFDYLKSLKKERKKKLLKLNSL